MSTKHLNYEVISWQGLLQMVVYLVGRGYYFWHVIYLSESKRDRWHRTDAKLINKYGCDISKFTRRDRKKRKVANFYYLRWEHVAVLLHTEGEILSKTLKEIEKNNDVVDEFEDIRLKAVNLRVSKHTAFDIYLEKQKIIKKEVQKIVRKKKGKQKNKKKVVEKQKIIVTERKDTFTVKLDKESYREIKSNLYDLMADKKSGVGPVISRFNKLNGLPAWHGIIKQKEALAKYVASLAKKHNVQLRSEDLRIFRTRAPVKMFKET